ncbi:hypothetical protein RND81_10G250000 [Saponaria officinalis]|uniref:Pentatricopeptide repeat-containing protein n=1 Tax=Saponaria officinalis TaxID=3572 RepID=A0AAW1I7K0_SAPOF
MMVTTLRNQMKASISITIRLFSGESHLLRRLNTASSPQQKWPENRREINKMELYSKLSWVGSSGQKLTDVLQHLSQNGYNLHNADLIFCLKRLRKYGRYHHCFQILEWMEKGSVDFSEHAIRLDLTCKLKGINEAETYFNNLPPHAKKPHLYGALLNCYCSKNMRVKALALFRKMDEMNWVWNSLAFDNLMSLYIKLDQPEKVHPLVQEMKQRNIPLSNVSYHIWLQSCGRLKDLASIERLMEEVEGQSSLKNDWKIYSGLATAYINVGQSQRAASALRKLEEVLEYTNLYDRTAYHHLISLYAKAGNEDSVFQAWGKLKSKFIECHNQSYLLMLQALSKLDNIEGLKKVLEEWVSTHKSYDVRLPSVAISAYLKHGMLEEAQLLFKDILSCGSGQKVWYAHASFMYYYLGRQQMDSALRHMEAAYVNGWKPSAEKLRPFFEYYKLEKHCHGVEKLCNMLKDVQALDSTAYLWLLQTYAAAGEEVTGMRQRMEGNGVNISSEHEELLSKICCN